MRLCAYELAIIGVLGLSGQVAAQQVTGRLRESSSSVPVSGAVVSLLDSSGHTLARTVSGADGRYRIAGEGHGTSVHVIRIGFRPATVAIRAGRDTVADIALTVLPTLLETVEVRGQTRCPQGRDVPGVLTCRLTASSFVIPVFRATINDRGDYPCDMPCSSTIPSRLPRRRVRRR